MIDALSASRRSLEAERSKALADVARTDEEIKTAEARLELLRSQRALQAGKRSSSPRVSPRCGGRLLMARSEGRRTIVDALDGLTAELRLANRLRLLSLPASVLEHDKGTKATTAVTRARVARQNVLRAEVRAALGIEEGSDAD